MNLSFVMLLFTAVLLTNVFNVSCCADYVREKLRILVFGDLYTKHPLNKHNSPGKPYFRKYYRFEYKGPGKHYSYEYKFPDKGNSSDLNVPFDKHFRFKFKVPDNENGNDFDASHEDKESYEPAEPHVYSAALRRKHAYYAKNRRTAIRLMSLQRKKPRWTPLQRRKLKLNHKTKISKRRPMKKWANTVR